MISQDAMFDCLAILDELYRPTQPSSRAERQGYWNLLWSDLIYRSQGLPNRELILNAGLQSQLPKSLRRGDWRVLLEPGAPNTGVKRQADIFIVCIIEKEFNATLAAFGLNQLTAKLEFITGHKVAQVQLDTRFCGRVNIWIGLVGEARNVVCAHFCRDVFERFAVRQCCILVGIAAGPEKVCKIGDVIGGRQVWDIEGARVEPSGEKPRLKPFPLRAPWSETFMGFDPNRWGWLAQKTRALELLKQSGTEVGDDWEKLVPEYKPGTIVVGEKLRRDTPLPSLRDRFGDEILAIEMEGSGFASACERKDKRWLVFRGVSDYGTIKKRDEWQSLAALHAALAARSFIVDGLPAAEYSALNPQF